MGERRRWEHRAVRRVGSDPPMDKGDIIPHFTHMEIPKAKSWRIIAPKNKGVLHIPWLPDRISTARVPWLSFHSPPKTSLSWGWIWGWEWESREHGWVLAGWDGQLPTGAGICPNPFLLLPHSPSSLNSPKPTSWGQLWPLSHPIPSHPWGCVPGRGGRIVAGQQRASSTASSTGLRR